MEMEIEKFSATCQQQRINALGALAVLEELSKQSEAEGPKLDSMINKRREIQKVRITGKKTYNSLGLRPRSACSKNRSEKCCLHFQSKPFFCAWQNRRVAMALMLEMQPKVFSFLFGFCISCQDMTHQAQIFNKSNNPNEETVRNGSHVLSIIRFNKIHAGFLCLF